MKVYNVEYLVAVKTNRWYIVTKTICVPFGQDRRDAFQRKIGEVVNESFDRGNEVVLVEVYHYEELIDEELLNAIQEEVNKFLYDNELLKNLVEAAIAAGIYPETSNLGTSAMTMAECYGAKWHQYRQPHYCGHCGSDLRNHDSGPPFKREIFVKPMQGNDGYYQCPDCGGKL